jgi:hypothetical protein
MSVVTEIREVADVSAGRRDEMYALMRLCYCGVRKQAFDADLAEKHWVIELAESATGELLGFSTQMLFHLEVAGQNVLTLFSGDTIVAPAARNSPALALAWGRLAFRLISLYPHQCLYWYLITKGYRTYRFLPVYFREFYPRYDVATPVWETTLVDALGKHKFGAAYDRVAQIVRATPASYHLRNSCDELTPERLADPHVRFFAARNPGHAAGDELCCLAPLREDNFSPVARRLIHSHSLAQQVCSGDSVLA